MRQQITKEQLDSLSDQAKSRLANWADPKEELLPLLTIGQLIWFLDDHTDGGNQTLTEYYGPWDGGFCYKDNMEWRVSSSDTYEELVDALWEVVKDALERGVAQR